MEVSMNQAALSALWSVTVGTLLGAVYDIIRFIRVLFNIDVRSPFKKGRFGLMPFLGYVAVCIGDLLFFVIAAILLCVFFFLTGDGQMRWYGLAGAFLGFVLYYNTFGRLFIRVAELLNSLIKRVIRFLLCKIGFVLKKIRQICMQFFDMPIVKAAAKRYNEYINKRKKAKRAAARLKKAKRGGGFVNGGTHG